MEAECKHFNSTTTMLIVSNVIECCSAHRIEDAVRVKCKTHGKRISERIQRMEKSAAKHRDRRQCRREREQRWSRPGEGAFELKKKKKWQSERSALHEMEIMVQKAKTRWGEMKVEWNKRLLARSQIGSFRIRIDALNEMHNRSSVGKRLSCSMDMCVQMLLNELWIAEGEGERRKERAHCNWLSVRNDSINISCVFVLPLRSDHIELRENREGEHPLPNRIV